MYKGKTGTMQAEIIGRHNYVAGLRAIKQIANKMETYRQSD